MKQDLRIIEAGHYYAAYGPTIWSQIGVDIIDQIRCITDKTMLFIDDVHPIANVSHFEKEESIIDLDYRPDYTVMESDMVKPATDLLEKLLSLPSKKRAHLNNKDGKYYISGFAITNKESKPLCVLLDAALTVHKYNMGFNHIINVLPDYYEHEQEHLVKILNKLDLPNLFFSVILYNKKGEFKQLQKYPAHLEGVHQEIIAQHQSL